MLLLIKVRTPSFSIPDRYWYPLLPRCTSPAIARFIPRTQLRHPSLMITHVQTKSIPLAKTLGTKLASRKCAIIIKDNKRKSFSKFHLVFATQVDIAFTSCWNRKRRGSWHRQYPITWWCAIVPDMGYLVVSALSNHFKHFPSLRCGEYSLLYTIYLLVMSLFYNISLLGFNSHLS